MSHLQSSHRSGRLLQHSRSGNACALRICTSFSGPTDSSCMCHVRRLSNGVVQEARIHGTLQEYHTLLECRTMAFTEPSLNVPSSNRHTPYVPKLSYRTNGTGQSNRDSSSTISTTSSSAPSTFPTSPTSATTSINSPGLPPDVVSPTNSSTTVNAMESRSSRSGSASVARVPPRSPGQPSKKKGGAFFTFLNVKEPSAQAFEDYQNQMRKKAQTHKGRATAVGMPGVSSAKLPPTVPKVNTKWDGVPRALKEKGTDKGNRQQRPSVSASTRSPGRDETDERTGTSRSRASTSNSTGGGNRLAEMYGWDSPSSSTSSLAKNFALEYARPHKTASTTTLPETTLFPTHPPLPVRSVSEQPMAPKGLPAPSSTPPPMPELPATSAIVPELSGIPSNVPELRGCPANLPELPSPAVGTIPELDAAPSMRDGISPTTTPPPPYVSSLEAPASACLKSMPLSPPPRNPLRPPPLPELQGDIRSPSGALSRYRSLSSTPSECSPVTPPDSAPMTSLSSPVSELGPDEGDSIHTTVVVVPQSKDTVIVKSAGVNIMPAPASARRRTPRHPSHRQILVAGEPEDRTVPDDQEPQLQSILKRDGAPRRPNPQARPSLADYFNAPTEKDSGTNAANVRERTFYSTKASPTASTRGSPFSVGDGKDGERITTPTPESGAQTLRRKARVKSILH